jgi:pimeloyl-ACP methyl ester carboxylesterase
MSLGNCRILLLMLMPKRGWPAVCHFSKGSPGFLVAALFLVVAGIALAQTGPQERARVLPVSTPEVERLVDVGGRKLDSCVCGSGSPTVVLVSGLEIARDNWDSVVPELAAKTAVVTYDRAGVGKSELGGLPTDGLRSAEDLHFLLEQLGVPKPYVLVGHSYGGMVARLYASRHPEDMGGLILEETQHEDNLIEMRKTLEGKDLEAFDRLLGERLRTPEKPVTEADYMNLTRDELRKSRPLPHIPFVVLVVAGRARAMKDLFSDEAVEKLDKIDNALNKKLAALVPEGRLVMVEGTGHLVHVDKPDVLIGPVVEMIEGIRAKK